MCPASPVRLHASRSRHAYRIHQSHQTQSRPQWQSQGSNQSRKNCGRPYSQARAGRPGLSGPSRTTSTSTSAVATPSVSSDSTHVSSARTRKRKAAEPLDIPHATRPSLEHASAEDGHSRTRAAGKKTSTSACKTPLVPVQKTIAALALDTVNAHDPMAMPNSMQNLASFNVQEAAQLLGYESTPTSSRHTTPVTAQNMKRVFNCESAPDFIHETVPVATQESDQALDSTFGIPETCDDCIRHWHPASLQNRARGTDGP